MKRVMIVFQSDFVKDANGQIYPSLGNLKEDLKKEEINYDIVAYYEKGNLVLFKNRFGQLASFVMNQEVDDFFLQD